MRIRESHDSSINASFWPRKIVRIRNDQNNQHFIFQHETKADVKDTFGEKKAKSWSLTSKKLFLFHYFSVRPVNLVGGLC